MLRSTDGIRDQIALFNAPARLRVPAFRIIDVLQKSNRRPGEQMLAAAVTLVAMCEAINYPLSDLIAKAVRVTSDVEGPFTAHLQAVRDYAANELRKGGY